MDFTVRFTQSGDWFYAEIPELRTSSAGDPANVTLAALSMVQLLSHLNNLVALYRGTPTDQLF